MKRGYLLSHAGRLGNQLWNLAAITAYCAERELALEDLAALDYSRHLSMPPVRSSPWASLLGIQERMAPLGRTPLLRRRYWRGLWRVGMHAPWDAAARWLPRLGGTLLEPGDEGVFFLPPSPNRVDRYREALHRAEEGDGPVWFRGWLFRNPIGLERHRQAVLRRLAPRAEIRARVEALLRPLRSRRVIGVHLRQGDYATFAGGRLALSVEDLRRCLQQFLEAFSLRASEVTFVIVSDGPVALEALSGLDVRPGLGGEAEDLWTLASTSLILGSNSTFGAMASWLGDVPMIVLSRQSMDWDYYRGRERYFEDKYLVINFLRGCDGYQGREDFFG